MTREEEIKKEIKRLENKHDKIMKEQIECPTPRSEKLSTFMMVLQDGIYEDIFEMFCQIRENKAELKGITETNDYWKKEMLSQIKVSHIEERKRILKQVEDKIDNLWKEDEMSADIVIFMMAFKDKLKQSIKEIK